MNNLYGDEATGDLVSDLREVGLFWVEGINSTKYIVHKRELAMFIEATKRLHVHPGINPHNNRPTAKLWKIQVSPITKHGPFWWAKPDLGVGDTKEHNTPGASTYEAGESVTIFLDNEED